MRNAARAVFSKLLLQNTQCSAAYSISLLFVWVCLAGVLRLHHLTLKPLWTDEFSTLVFGLGKSFKDVPLNQLLSASTLLEPIRLTSDTTMADAADRLLSESNHPPLYFMLTHAWVHHFSDSDGYVSVWAARSLSVLFGVLAVPAMYLAGWIACRSKAIAHLSAVLMAVSPFGIYLAQDARHYTLAVLWMILSITCLLQAVRCYVEHKPIPRFLLLGWVGINSLGIASHYFFLMTLAAEAIALATILLYTRKKQMDWDWSGIRQFTIVIVGTAASVAAWAPFFFSIRQGDALTGWLDADGWQDWTWINPLLHTLGSIVSMVMLFPVQNVDDGVVIASAICITGFALMLGWFCYRGIAAKLGHSKSNDYVLLLLLLAFLGGAIALLFLTTYGLGVELAQVFRYHFFYFPGILLLVAVGIVGDGNRVNRKAAGLYPCTFLGLRQWLIVVLIALGIIGSLTVSSDLGYRKLHRPDRIVREIDRRSEHPIFISISHQTHGQTGRLMALAWELRSPRYQASIPQTSFLLDHQPCAPETKHPCYQPSDNLRHLIDEMHHPIDLWLINYEGQARLSGEGCEHQRTRRTDGYKAQHYTCHV